MPIPTSLRVPATSSKFVGLSIKLDDPVLDTLQFQHDQTSSGSQLSRSVLSNRILHPGSNSVEEVGYKVTVPGFGDLAPLKLGSKYISDMIKIDNMIPNDLYSQQYLVKEGGMDNYFFDSEKGLGDFSRFEKIGYLALPDKFFDEYNSSESSSKMGVFSPLDRAWIAVDNKLILWNYKLPTTTFAQSQFLTLELKNTILFVQLVKPKPGIFLENVHHLLVIATLTEIKIYILQSEGLLSLEIFDPELSVSTHGITVNQIVENTITHDIYFSGDGNNIWRLDYSNKATFTKNKCDKVCLTKSGFSLVLPVKIGLPWDNSNDSSNTNSGVTSGSKIGGQNNHPAPETIVQLQVDSERGILYSLLTKSVIRVYKLDANQEQFTNHSQLLPSEIFKGVSSLFVDAANIESFSKFRIMTIQYISSKESSNIQLIAVTNYGCRILLRLGGASSGSFSNFMLSFSRLKLAVVSVKFPPSKEVATVNPDLDQFTKEKQYLAQLVNNQRKLQLLKNTKFAKIISPGVFLNVKRTKGSDKLFICTANYGFLKKNNKLVEDAELISFGGGDNTTYIHEIVQLTPLMNASNTPNGYANVLASQYTSNALQFAVLTNFGIHFFQYRTPDKVLRSLKDETLENFIEENGFEETCSTLLYLSCNETFSKKERALQIFSILGNNARLIQREQQSGQQGGPQGSQQQQFPLQSILRSNTVRNDHATVEEVILLDRFYGTCILISRLFRDVWNKKVFTKLDHIKTLGKQFDLNSVKEDKLLIKGLNIDKKETEFFIGLIVVLLDYFLEYGGNIQGLSSPSFSLDPLTFDSELCIRAEHIAFTSILKLLLLIREALLFIMVLLEESQQNSQSFNDILKYLLPISQVNLLSVTFKDLLLPSTEVKNLIKDILSLIINKNILKGGSIDLIANLLQSRCGLFCLANDVFIFKAIENLTRAKSVGARDNDLRIKCLESASKLFEKAYESLTLENIENSVNIMLDLEFYVGTIKLLLNIGSRIGAAAIASTTTPGNPTSNQVTLASSTNSVQQPATANLHTKQLQLYELVFKILTEVDGKAAKLSESTNQLALNEFLETREAIYDTCFALKDKAFHMQFYQWFINQGIPERLLSVNTPFILIFLENGSRNLLALTDLLWLYHAKRENYFNAAQILYELAILEFPLSLSQRIEYLLRAIGFCNCACIPTLRQKMIKLLAVVQELFDVASVQLDILYAIKKDNRISASNKEIASSSLDGKVLDILDLFNQYTDPLGYYDLCLIIFDVSEYRNTDDILKRWELYFEKIFHDFMVPNKGETKEKLYVMIGNAFAELSPKLSLNDVVFPLDLLVRLTCKYIREATDEDSQQKPPVGAIVDVFIKAGVSYEKLYYTVRNLLEHPSFEFSLGFSDDLKKEIVPLIKNWYQSDKRLKSIIPAGKIRDLEIYNAKNDPINAFIKSTGE